MSTDPFRMDGRTATVTGGGSGIGRAITIRLAVMGEPADMAYAALYLASDAARYMTGQTLHPHGGIARPW